MKPASDQVRRPRSEPALPQFVFPSWILPYQIEIFIVRTLWSVWMRHVQRKTANSGTYFTASQCGGSFSRTRPGTMAVDFYLERSRQTQIRRRRPSSFLADRDSATSLTLPYLLRATSHGARISGEFLPGFEAPDRLNTLFGLNVRIAAGSTGRRYHRHPPAAERRNRDAGSTPVGGQITPFDAESWSLSGAPLVVSLERGPIPPGEQAL